MNDNNESLIGVIDPLHLLLALRNSLEHSDETAHGVTGLTFKNYTIKVRKKQDFCWIVDCKFKKRDAEQNNQKDANARSQCRTRLKKS
jgi:hypothetical protein